MSATAAITAGDPYYKAFFAGARWGIGHSTGLCIVAIIFIACGGKINLDEVGHYVDWLVGILMISLGLYTMYKAYASVSSKEEGDEEFLEPLPLS